MTQERQPFQSEWDPDAKPKKGLKISNTKSSVNVTERKHAEFQQAAEEFINDQLDRKQQMIDLVKEYMAALRDKTLSSNKSPIALDYEKEVCTKLVSLGLVINQDENEPEGYGSIALINLLLKANLLLRDTVNDMQFKIANLEKQMSSSAVSSDKTNE